MKKLVFLLGVLLSLGMFCACSSDDEINDLLEDKSSTDSSGSEDKNGAKLIYPITEGTDYVEITHFFQSNYYLGSEYHAFFEGSNESQFLAINSSDELLSKYTGTDPFPTIDFNKYTLIVGQEMMPKSFYNVLRQELISEGDELRLNVYVPQLGEAYTAFQHLFYWGLYPKLHSSKIAVTIIEEQL